MLNTVILMGRLTADPELRTTPNGTAVTSFRIAVDRHSSDKQTDFIDITAWRGTAELVCRYFAKGRMIALQGRIQTRSYEDKQGNKRTAFEVVAESVSFCGDKSGRNAGGEPARTGEQDWTQQAFDEADDLPFP